MIIIIISFIKIISETPQGSMPVLDVKDGPTIVQSCAIARYLAREFSKYIHVGENNKRPPRL